MERALNVQQQAKFMLDRDGQRRGQSLSSISSAVRGKIVVILLS